jgi:hypothetical protein
MRLTALLSLALVALFSLAMSARPALAQQGAIAYDRANCAWGDSWNFGNSAAADAAAMAKCNHPGCQLMTQIGPHQCGALASTPNCSGYGWATRPNRAAAELGAMQQCQGYNAGQCILRLSDCNN